MSHCGFRVLEIGGQQARQGAQRAVHVRKGLALANAADQRVAPRSVVRIHRRRRPHARRRTGEPEALRHDADDGPRDAAELQRLADDVRIAAQFLPQRVAEQSDHLCADQILALPERSPQHRRRAEDVEQLRGNGDAGNQPQRVACGLERQVFGPIRAHSFETRKVRAQPEELLLVPRSAEPEHADLLLPRHRQRIEKKPFGHAVDGSRSTGAKRKGGDGQRRIEWSAHQPSHRVPSVHDPALEHRSSWPKPVGVRLESRHAAPPASAEQRRRGPERLTPRPTARGGFSVRDDATPEFSGELAQDFVPLRDRQQRAEQRPDDERRTPREEVGHDWSFYIVERRADEGKGLH